MPTKACYRPDLFERTRLTTLARVEEALEELKPLLCEGSISRVLDAVIDGENQTLLALVIAAAPQSVMDSFLAQHPKTNASYHNSVHERFTNHLSHAFVFVLEPLADRETNQNFNAMYQNIQSAAVILKTFYGYIPPASTKEEDHPFPVKKSQKQRKKGKVVGNVIPVVDIKHYELLFIAPPVEPHHVYDVLEETLRILRKTASYYVQYLQTMNVIDTLKRLLLYVPPQTSQETESQSIEEQQEAVEESDLHSAYPMVQPMRSALHFDSPEGFGAWKIIISRNAHETLRTTHRKDGATFDIIVRKIKDLSSGHFSGDNQKRLVGTVVGDVAVYEAKMSRDLRLVYQIDIIPSDGEREEQAVKIFGIYTHAQMDNRLWASIGSQLRKKGQEYRNRCAVRKPSEHADKDMFVPESFPPLPEVSSSEVENLPDLLPDDTAQVHSRLVVEKFVTFSQPFLNSIMADLDITLPHLVSSQEKKIIENATSCYVIGRSGTGKTTTMLFKMLLIERTYLLMGDNISKPRQVFVTKSRMLAKKVQEYFEKLGASLIRASQTLAELRKLSSTDPLNDNDDAEADLVDQDDDTDWRVDLPQKFSELEDKHFPLFITYDELCDLLEADARAAKGIKSKVQRSQNTLISFETFESSYWSHFSETLRKGLDPALVFSEIIGVIKGSEESLTRPKRFLSKDIYLDLSRRQHSTLADRTEDVYSLFEAYMQMKKAARQLDVADRTHAVLKFLGEHELPGSRIDHLYIDEVQDNLLIDTMVLRALCSNSHGLFWAGDTAQTISAGSSFRFDGLKAFQFRLETEHRKKIGSYEYVEDPELFQLAVNYRSHAGIVDCAHSVIDLITRFWSDSIDRLSPEQGIVDGFKPVFFSNDDRDQLENFIFGDVGSHIEFGAQQCIIVRNEAAKERLLRQVGEVGLVLTIYESKGLEFNDVLLYDFFSDSVVGAPAWRVVLGAIEDWSRVGDPMPVPTFDSIKHASVCTELKSLYVAITRARENVWMADGSETGKWMRMYWTSRNLIQNYAPGKDAPQLATSSTAKEWESQGRELFDQKKYGPAKHCFTRAKLPKLAAVANAYYRRQRARALPTTKQRLSERRAAFQEAAEAFLNCAQQEDKDKVKTTYLRNSALCFEECGDLERAALIHRRAKNFNRSGELYRDLKKFDDAVDVVNAARDVMQHEIVASIIKRARLAYFDSREIVKGCQLFETTDEALEYLEDRGLDMARADLLESLGNYREAAELHYEEGRREKAIPLFLKQKDDVDSLQRGVECIIEGLWHHCSFAKPPNQVAGDADTQRLLSFIPALSKSVLTNDQYKELAMFQAISACDTTKLMVMGLEYLQENNQPSALMCLDHVFAWPLQLQSSSLPEVIKQLGVFDRYTTLLSQAAFLREPSKSDSMKRLFGFVQAAENTINIPASAYFLHRYLERERNVAGDIEFSMTVSEMHHLFHKALSNRLRRQAETAYDACLICKAFSPCLSFVASGNCPRNPCPENHILAKHIGPDYYNQRVYVHLLQMVIFQSLRDINTHSRQEDDSGPKRVVFGLYNALYPPHSSLGSIADLNIAGMPQAKRGFALMRHWVQSIAYKQRFRPTAPFLTNVLRISMLAYAFDRSKIQTTQYLYSAPYWTSEARPSQYILYREFMVKYLLATVAGLNLGGALAMRHIVEKKMPIHVPVLCDFVNLVMSSTILCGRAKMANFHGVTLPRSWLIKYLAFDAPYFSPHMRTKPDLIFLESLKDVLQQLYDGSDSAGYLLYGNDRPMSTLPYAMRNVFVSRIVQAMSLLAYNIDNRVLREIVRKAVASLKRSRPTPELFRVYVDASQNWEGLARAIRTSLANSSDPMIHLQERSKIRIMTRSHPDMRRIIFDKPGDILGLLRNTTATTTATPAPAPVIEERDGKEVDESVDETAQEERGAEDAAQTGEVDEEEEEQLEERPPPSDEEHAAASVLQSIYRRTQARRKGASRTGLAGTLGQLYTGFLEAAPSNMDPPYRVLVFGPLVHILLCLDIAKTDSIEHKKRTKAQLKKSESAEMERLDDLLTQTNRTHRSIGTLQKDLRPDSPIHQNGGDIMKLLRHVQKAKDVLSSLPFETSSDISLHLALGVKGILTVRNTSVRPKPKPGLVVDDEIDDVY